MCIYVNISCCYSGHSHCACFICWLQSFIGCRLVHIGNGFYGHILSRYESQSIGFESKLCWLTDGGHKWHWRIDRCRSTNIRRIYDTSCTLEKTQKKIVVPNLFHFEYNNTYFRCFCICFAVITWRMATCVLGYIRHFCGNNRNLFDLGIGWSATMELSKTM